MSGRALVADLMLFWCLEVKEALTTLRSFAQRAYMSWIDREHARNHPLRRRTGKGGMSIHAHAIYAAAAEMRRWEQY